MTKEECTELFASYEDQLSKLRPEIEALEEELLEDGGEMESTVGKLFHLERRIERIYRLRKDCVDLAEKEGWLL